MIFDREAGNPNVQWMNLQEDPRDLKTLEIKLTKRSLSLHS